MGCPNTTLPILFFFRDKRQKFIENNQTIYKYTLFSHSQNRGKTTNIRKQKNPIKTQSSQKFKKKKKKQRPDKLISPRTTETEFSSRSIHLDLLYFTTKGSKTLSLSLSLSNTHTHTKYIYIPTPHSLKEATSVSLHPPTQGNLITIPSIDGDGNRRIILGNILYFLESKLQEE